MSRAGRWLLAATLAALAPPEAHGLSLRSSAAQLKVEASPGRRLDVGKDAGGPLTIADTGGTRVAVEARVESPPGADAVDGYEPAPDPRWFSLDPPRLELSPGSEAAWRLTVEVPPDRGREGGQYEADVVAVGRSPDGLSARLRTRVLLRVKRDRGRIEALDRTLIRRPRDVAPSRSETTVRDAPLGRVVDVDALAAALKLANADAETAYVRVESSEPDPREAPDGYEPAPNPGWLTAGDGGVVEVAAGKVASARLRLRVPDEPRYRGRRWAFAVDVEALGARPRVVRRFWLKVTTAGSGPRREGSR